ncbi:heme NO-binding domain-containing protein [Wenyingzhuangia aestuarii]|uniref:heme NO-binding domain-containing protein n=1 Tax=Wenyingzhuangia aestuarii TaxID=1647582 RepID=UPI00143AC864|nr:heme NO-binding domain-containing protein [Wenyingzhuangia aestuarii]NJB82455.1 hypothetical protein [Wenyingzhuangia aestuarii]
MKGIVFTEFLELVEEQFGIETVQQIIDQCELSTEGIYTAVGTYSHKDIFMMVQKLSELKEIPIPELLKVYGKYFFTVLSNGYPQFMKEKDLFSFLDSIDNYIHVEVLKLYPDAELPKFDSEIIDNKMTLLYQSTRKMSDFAIGLILGAAEYYNEPNIKIEVLKLEDEGQKAHIKIERFE